MSRRSTAAALGAVAALGVGLTVDRIAADADVPPRSDQHAGGHAAATTQHSSQSTTTQNTANSTTTTTETRSESHTTQRDGETNCSVRIVERVNGHEQVRTDQDQGTDCTAHAETHTSHTDISGTTTADVALTPSTARRYARKVIQRHADSPGALRVKRCRAAGNRRFKCRATWSPHGHARLTIRETTNSDGRHWNHHGTLTDD